MKPASTAWLCPRTRLSASNSVTRRLCESSQAAGNPETPPPIAAMFSRPGAGRLCDAASISQAWSSMLRRPVLSVSKSA